MPSAEQAYAGQAHPLCHPYKIVTLRLKNLIKEKNINLKCAYKMKYFICLEDNSVNIQNIKILKYK